MARRHYHRRGLGGLLDRLFNRFTWKYWIIGGVALIVILGAVMLVQFGRRTTPADTPLHTRQQIVVGVAADVPNFGTVDASGQPAGLDRDVAAQALGAIYPEKELLFVEIESQQASYLLREGQIDLAVGMFPSGMLRTQGLAVSQPYFTDGVYAYVSDTGAYPSVASLQGRRAGVMTSEVTKRQVDSALSRREMKIETTACTSYPDGIASVKAGASAALFAPRCKMIPYEGELSMLNDPLCTVGYCVIGWSSQKETMTLVNEQIEQMRRDEQIELLCAKWGVSQTAIDSR